MNANVFMIDLCDLSEAPCVDCVLCINEAAFIIVILRIVLSENLKFLVKRHILYSRCFDLGIDYLI